jgi:hypothetical protein
MIKKLVIQNLERTGEIHLFNEQDFNCFNRKNRNYAHTETKAENIANAIRLTKLCVKASNSVELFHEYLDSIYFEGKAEQLAAESPEEYSLLLNDYLHGRY